MIKVVNMGGVIIFFVGCFVGAVATLIIYACVIAGSEHETERKRTG